jgi:formate--tetrahydrofolate ligase
MRNLPEVASALDLGIEAYSLAGPGVGKLHLAPDGTVPLGARRGKLVLVSAITPTSHGEGKTVTAIGLAMALSRRGHRAVPCLRQPSLGPVFGLKGGATGGGRATVEPSAAINLGFTGDLHAVASAQNLLAALLDNHLHYGNALEIDPATIDLPRTVDLDDRALRHIRVGAGANVGPERPDRFVIAAASEVAAIHTLGHGFRDVRERLGRILLGRTTRGDPVRADDLRAGGALAALLRPALEPNLVATSEGTPALVHAGPFANLGPGTASVASIRFGLAHADMSVVEAGFATELGAEKFVDLVSPVGRFAPDAAVLVATVPGLRYHGGGSGDGPDPGAVERGLPNLGRHIANLKRLGLSTVVALNRYPQDDPAEIALVRAFCEERGVFFAPSRAFAEGGAGAAELAERVEEALARGAPARPLLHAADPLPEKLAMITREMYGGTGARLESAAEADLAGLASVGMDRAPICVAKTQLSLSDDPHRRGAPSGFEVTVHRFHPYGGAGFVVAALGEILTMPGLPRHPAAEHIGLSDDGRIVGLD